MIPEYQKSMKQAETFENLISEANSCNKKTPLGIRSFIAVDQVYLSEVIEAYKQTLIIYHRFGKDDEAKALVESLLNSPYAQSISK